MRGRLVARLPHWVVCHPARCFCSMWAPSMAELGVQFFGLIVYCLLFNVTAFDVMHVARFGSYIFALLFRYLLFITTSPHLCTWWMKSMLPWTSEMCQLWPTILRSATVFTVTVVKPFTPNTGQIKITSKTLNIFLKILRFKSTVKKFCQKCFIWMVTS